MEANPSPHFVTHGAPRAWQLTSYPYTHDCQELYVAQAAMMHLTNANPGLAASLGAAQGPPLAPISAPVGQGGSMGGQGGSLGVAATPLMTPGLASLPSMNGVVGAPTLTSVAVAANGEPFFFWFCWVWC